MRILSIAAAVAAALIPAMASAADYHAPRPAPRRHHVQHHYAPMPVYREVALPTIAPPKPLYYVPSPVYYVQHLGHATCGACGYSYRPEPGRWVKHSHWPW